MRQILCSLSDQPEQICKCIQIRALHITVDAAYKTHIGTSTAIIAINLKCNNVCYRHINKDYAIRLETSNNQHKSLSSTIYTTFESYR